MDTRSLVVGTVCVPVVWAATMSQLTIEVSTSRRSSLKRSVVVVRIRDVAYRGRHLEEAGIAELHYAPTPEEAIELALALAEQGRDDAPVIEREFRATAAMRPPSRRRWRLCPTAV